MKDLLLFLSLTLLSVPANADKFYNNQKCLQMYLDIVIDFKAGKMPPAGMMSYYGQTCITANKGDPEHTALIDAVLSNELVVAIKAKLAEQDLIKL